MYVSQELLHHSREQTLNNLLGLSTACLNASQRLSEVFAAASRDTLHHGSRQLAQFSHGQVDSLAQFPTVLWLEGSARHSRLLDAASTILAETHETLIRTAEAQVRLFDQLVYSWIRHAENSSPWEGEIALAALRTSLESAETTLHGMSAAAIGTVQLAENNVHQVTENLTENPRTTRPNGRGRTTHR